MNAIEVDGLCKSFGLQRVVVEASFFVQEGELAAVLGPSGSGKSTLLRLLAGLEQPDGGSIALLGKRVMGVAPQNRGLGFVFQHYALFTHMTVFENIAFGLRVQKMRSGAIADRVGELIELVKLEGYEQRYPHQLSGGQRQRVALARALAPKPKLLLLDEPFGALDAKVRKSLGRWLKALHKSMEVTTLFVTHDQVEALEIADRLILLNNGRVEQSGTPKEVYDTPATRFSASFLGQVNVIMDEGSEGNEAQVLLVRYEDIVVRTDAYKGGIVGQIVDLRFRGAQYEIEIETAHHSLLAHVERRSWEGMAVDVQRPVYLSWRNHSMFPIKEGHEQIARQLSDLGYLE